MFGVMIQAQVITVVDQQTDEPIEFATILSTTPSGHTSTNAAGQADISSFIESESIEIRYLGYRSISRSYQDLMANGLVIAMEPSGIFLDQVVISASRWSQRSRDVPNHVATISSLDAQLQNPQTAADLLSASGEVFIQKSQQGGGSPMIRGFATNRLLYAVDGVRMNTAIFRSGNIQNVISLDPFTVEHAEVLFGPGSVIYGSDAIGGVMSFTTLTPQRSFNADPLISGSAAARYASANNEKTVHFNVNAGWNKWAFVSSFTSNDFGDLRMGSKGPDEYLRPTYVERADSVDHVVANADPQVQRPSGYGQINLMQKVLFAPSKSWEIQYGVHYSTTTTYPRYDRLLRLGNDLPRSAEWNYGPQQWLMNQLSVNHLRSGRLYDQISIRLAYQFFEESRIDRDLNKPTRFSRIENVNAFSGNLDFVKSIRKVHRFIYGVEAVVNDVESEGTDENVRTGEVTTGPSRYPQATWSSFGVYASYQHRVSAKLLFQVGTRYNHFSLDADFSGNTAFFPLPFETAKIQNGSLTGSLGVIVNPQEDLTLSANLSTGFRSPNVDDIGKIFDSTPGSVVVPNPDLSAEYAYNAEVSLAKVFAERIRIDLTGYYTILDNALVRRAYQLNGMDSIIYDGELSRVEAVQNAASAHVFGIQAGVEIKLGKGFSLMSRINIQDGEEELDDGTTTPLRHAAPWFGVSRLMLKADKLVMQLYAMYSGEVSYGNLSEEGRGTPYIFAVDAQGNPYSPGWMTLNFKVSYPITSKLIVSGGVENILDKRYRPYSSGLVAAGRNVLLSVRAKF
jgi:hemoglobin/transferrin/lactoferrin receptor protein